MPLVSSRSDPVSIMSLTSRLKDRKVVQWGIGYLAGAWVAVQVLGFMAGIFDWPLWIVRAAIVVLAVGAVAAVIVAWFHGELGHQRVTRLELALLGLVAVAGGLASWAVVRHAGTKPGIATDPRAIAVLPFANFSADPANEYFSDGITEELLNALAQLPGVRVAARTSSFAFKGKNLPLDSVARALNVRRVLEGSVRKDGNHVRVRADLVDASNGYHMWDHEYDRELKDVFAIQSEIARSIAGELRVQLEPGAQQRLARAPTANPEAHNRYLQGRFFFNKRSPAALAQAVDYFQQAIRLDSTYAAAWSGLADALAIRTAVLYVPLAEGLPQAERAADRALALDSSSAEAHASRANVLELRHEWEGAEAEYRRAIQLEPLYATAHQWYATLLATLGRPTEALAEARAAVAADPLSAPANNLVGLVLLYDRQYAAATEQFLKTLQIDPAFAAAQGNLARSLAGEGKLDDAIGQLNRAIPTRPDPGNLLATLAYVYMRQGKPGEARAVLRQAASDPRVTGGARRVALARLYATLGERDSAFAYLYQADWTTETVHGLRGDERLASLRSDPRYPALLRTLGLN